jgi:predicted Fe-Mo cluster-binding NifX family protein
LNASLTHPSFEKETFIMKVAVTASGKDLDASIDPRFGRCAYFMIVDTDSMHFEVFENENMNLGSGAGIQSAQFIAGKGGKVLITGNVGPNAARTLAAAGIQLIAGQTGTVRQAIENYKNGNLKPTTASNVPGHFGMGGGAGMGSGRGRGMGRGMGAGGGGGRGGRGRGF